MTEWCIVDFQKFREKGIEAITVDRIQVPDELMDAIAMEPWQYREEWLRNCKRIIKKMRLRCLLYPVKRYFCDYERNGDPSNRRIGRKCYRESFLLDLCARYLLRKYQAQHFQGSMIFCPGCGLELCRSDSWFSDTDLVRYKCIQCGKQSGWLFDAPAPLLIERPK